MKKIYFLIILSLSFVNSYSQAVENITYYDEFTTEIIVTIVGASISAFVLLMIHHRKVKQEIKIHGNIDNFNERKKAYHDLLQLVSKMSDHSHTLEKPVNWKIIRHIYNEIMLIGSKEVVDVANKFFIDSDTFVGEKEHEAIKRLWNAIRKDLYDETIPLDQMHIINPSPETVTALNLLNTHLNDLKPFGITTLKDAANMNLDDLVNRNALDGNKDNLEAIKKMAIKEIEISDDFEQFLKDKI